MAIDYVQVGQRLRAHRVVDLHQKLAEQMWNRAAKDVNGAASLRKCLKEPQIWAGDPAGENSRHCFVCAWLRLRFRRMFG